MGRGKRRVLVPERPVPETIGTPQWWISAREDRGPMRFHRIPAPRGVACAMVLSGRNPLSVAPLKSGCLILGRTGWGS